MRSGKKAINTVIFHSSDSITKSQKLQLGNTGLSLSGDLTPAMNSNENSNTPSSAAKLTIFNADSYMQSTNRIN
jgi:hypothetical protein